MSDSKESVVPINEQAADLLLRHVFRSVMAEWPPEWLPPEPALENLRRASSHAVAEKFHWSSPSHRPLSAPVALWELVDALVASHMDLVEENAHQLVGGANMWSKRLRKLDKLRRAARLEATHSSDSVVQETSPRG